MKRRLINLLAAVSLVLCLAFIAMGIASRRQTRAFMRSVAASDNSGFFIVNRHRTFVNGIPLDIAVAATAILPLTWIGWVSCIGILRWNQARRRAKGLCTRCGYDLRASKERCPECGTAIRAGGRT